MLKPAPPHSHPSRLLWAGFMALVAAGVGFAIRAGILKDWAADFGFTQGELGRITGGGLTGFGLIILLGSLLAEKIGYGRLMVFAFLAHVVSALLTVAAAPVYHSLVQTDPEAARAAAYPCLFWGTFLFAIGNGVAEAVINPMVASLFPDEKAHKLNLLHAGWPGGLIVGGLLSFAMVGRVRWETQMLLFLIPTVLYGAMMWRQRFPQSEARAGGVRYRHMLGELGLGGGLVVAALLYLFFRNDLGWTPVASAATPVALLIALGTATGFRAGPWLMATLLGLHALVGYVELGTDSWIGTITGTILSDRGEGLLLFVYTSALMFGLRFFAGPIVHRISPLGLLLVSAMLGAAGLLLLGRVTTGVLLIVAATVYGMGKTFFWPTMLAVVSEQFPRGGAIVLGAMGAVGMLSAGLLGGPGIGYLQDRHAAEQLRHTAPEAYTSYEAQQSSRFLFFAPMTGLDGRKVTAVREKPAAERTPVEQLVADADLQAGRHALRLTAIVPALMGLGYLLLIVYFRLRGGYRARQVAAPTEGDAPAAISAR